MKKLMLILSSILVMFAAQSCEENVTPDTGKPSISIKDLAPDFESKSVCFKIESNQPEVSFTLKGAVESSIPAEAYDKDKIYKINDLAEGDYTLTVNGYDAEGKESCNATANFSIKEGGNNPDNPDNPDTPEVPEVNGDITIAADKTSGKTGETIKFTASTAEGDVTKLVTFKDAKGFEVSSDYVIDFVGEQEFYAVSGDKKSTNSVKIAATFNNSENYYKRNLILQFTATWCGYCPQMIAALEELQADYAEKGEPEKFGIIAIHRNDEFTSGNKDRLIMGNRLADRFGVDGLPTAVIDYWKTASQSKSQLKMRCEESQKANPATVGIGIQTRVDENGKLFIKANLRANEAGEYKLGCAYVMNNQKVAGTNHQHVGTKFFTHELGDNIDLPAGTFVEKEFSTEIDKTQIENIEVIVFVLKSTDGEFRVNNMHSALAGKSVPAKLK